ncbi:MAG TPA: hypothetical protein VN816_05480 [Acidimicrobiales bacterium]|nr:hypothetical protein [Acidimicrobiales bacterium]
MSDMSQGPGWWIASDGKWYPPHLHPSVRVPEQPGSGPGSVTDVSHRSALGPDAFGQPPEAHSPASRSRTPVAVVLGVAVVILLVVGAVVVFGGSKSASAEVTDAVNSALQNGTAHVSLTISGKADGTSLSGTGSGKIDFTNSALAVQMTIGADGQQVGLTAIYLGGVIYETLPGLAAIAHGKTWLSLDLSALQKAEAQDPSTEGLGNNPDVMLQMLAQQGNTVVPLGPSTDDGVAVNGYAVTVKPSSITEQLKKANLPAWMQRSVAGLKVHAIALKVFVDHAGMLRSFETQLSESTSTGALSFDESLAFSDYGTPVNVTAPPADQVETFEQLLQAAGTQGAPSS